MLHQDLTAAAVGHAIHLAVAPVFLITGIGAMLGVLASRLGRIVDNYTPNDYLRSPRGADRIGFLEQRFGHADAGDVNQPAIQ